MTATIEAPQAKRQSKSAQMRKYGFFPGCVAKESCKELFNSTSIDEWSTLTFFEVYARRIAAPVVEVNP